MRILIIGAGGHARVVADILLCVRESSGEFEPIGYLDDDPSLKDMRFLGLPVLGTLANLGQIPHDAVILGIGANRTRSTVFQKLQQGGERFARAIHPTALIARSAQVQTGSAIGANAVVGVNARVGANVILNTACTVDHDNVVGDHAHLSAGVHLGGGAVIGAGVLVGIGATVMPQIHVGDWSIVGAGALVHRAVAAGATVVGVPARVLRATARITPEEEL